MNPSTNHPPINPWKLRLKAFLRLKTARWSLGFLTLIALAALLAPWITHYSYETQNIAERLEPPSWNHWLGTDSLGRDLFSRILYGARISLAVGVATAFFALILGTFTGAISGYFGGWVDQLLMRTVDLFTIFPSLLLAILITLLVGRGFTGICLALGIASWVTQARLVRGMVLQLREQAFVESAHALGVPRRWILFRHILPNLAGPIMVSLSIQIPNNILNESFLSFIGLGLQPPLSSWGTLAAEGARAMESYPHLTLYPSVILFVTILAFNFLGDALSDAFNPKADQASRNR